MDPDPLADIFQDARKQFEDGLSEKQRREFKACSLKDVEDTIRGIDTRLASQRRQQNMQRITKFLEGMDQLGKVVEVFLNCHATVAFIWGPVKFVLLTASTWVETLDSLLDTYAEIGEFLPSLAQYKALLGKHPYIGVHLRNYYCDVLEFHRKALSVFSRPSWKVAFHSSWRTFKSQFGGTLAKLRRHRDLLSDQKITAAVTEVQELRLSVEDKLDHLSRKIQELNLRDEDESLRHHELTARKRQCVLSKLEPPDYGSDLERAWNERSGSHSGDWILSHATFRGWEDMGSAGHRVLYVNGIPGTGKTILASRVIQHLQHLQSSNGHGRAFSVLYFFFKHFQPEKRTLIGMLLSLLSQMVFQDEVTMDLLYQGFLKIDQQKIRSVSLLRELAAVALGTQTKCFVVVDALDECVGEPSTASEAAQEEVIDWFESLIMGANSRSNAEQDDRRIRLLICGQRNGLLEDRLRHCPTISLDSCHAHIKDIETYSRAKCLQIQQKFKVSDDILAGVICKVNSGAKGMFLYVKIVLDNLLGQPTLGHFKRELREENFPKGLEKAYERVAVHILDGPDDQRANVARRILGLVICAERPLLWKEIQSRFCIDIQNETADADFRLLQPCKVYCGSLVEVDRSAAAPALASEERVELVHETARVYLLQTERFRMATLNSEMALFCAQYLSSKPFASSNCETDIRMHCRTGYYGFLDYVVANWWKHAKRLEATRDSPEAMHHVAKLTKLLGRDQRKYDPEETLRAATATAWDQVHELPDDGREWEEAFPAENIIKPIRTGIEALLATQDDDGPPEVEEIRELYGLLRYKCIKPWCQSFLDGFEKAQERDNHVNLHERPYRCETEGCYGSVIGFAKQLELGRHNERAHTPIAPLGFPSIGPPRAEPADKGIFRAVTKGDLDAVQRLIAAGVDVNVRDEDSATPLFRAARAGQYQICQWLLSNGANVNSRCTTKRLSALHAAVTTDDAEIAHLLISHGADIYARNKSGESMFSLVKDGISHSKVVTAFPSEYLQHRDCTKSDCWFERPRGSANFHNVTTSQLDAAIRQSDINSVRYYIQNACLDINFLDQPLDINFLDRPSSALDLALMCSSDEIVDELLQTNRTDLDTPGSPKNKNRDLPLHIACSEGRLNMVQKLFPLTTGSLRDEKGKSNRTPLEALLHNLQRRLGDLAESDFGQVTTILESGWVDLQKIDEKGMTTLHRACARFDAPIVKLLLPHAGSIINMRDREGLAPFQTAFLAQNLPVVSLLLGHGAVNLFTKSDCGTAIAITDAEKQSSELLSALVEQDPGLLTEPKAMYGGGAFLHRSAVYLDVAAISILSTMPNPPVNLDGDGFLELPSEWVSRLSVPRSWKHGLGTPLFLAMKRAFEHITLGTPSVLDDKFKPIFNTLLSVPSLNLSVTYNPTNYFECEKVKLVDSCCDSDMVRRMARAGLSWDWKVFAWDFPPKTITAQVTSPITGLAFDSYRLKHNWVVLAVVCGGRCRFVDIARENFAFARDTLASGCVEPGSLNLEGEDELLALVYENEAVDMLRDLIDLGLDGESALLRATEAGNKGGVEMLMRTGSVIGKAAHEVAMARGFEEIAAFIWWPY